MRKYPGLQPGMLRLMAKSSEDTHGGWPLIRVERAVYHSHILGRPLRHWGTLEIQPGPKYITPISQSYNEPA